MLPWWSSDNLNEECDITASNLNPALSNTRQDRSLSAKGTANMRFRPGHVENPYETAWATASAARPFPHCGRASPADATTSRISAQSNARSLCQLTVANLSAFSGNVLSYCERDTARKLTINFKAENARHPIMCCSRRDFSSISASFVNCVWRRKPERNRLSACRSTAIELDNVHVRISDPSRNFDIVP